MSEEILKGQEPSKDEEVKQQLEAEGWQLAGKEFASSTPLNPDTGRFESKRLLSDDEIKEKYLALYGQHGFTEVHLEPHRKTSAEQEATDNSLMYVYLR